MVSTSSDTKTHSTPSTGRKSNKKKLGIIIAAVVLIAAGLAVAWYFIDWNGSRETDSQAIARVCHGEAARSMQSAIKKGDHEALIAQSQQIQGVETYKADASCVYIVAEAEIMQGDAEAAKGQYSVLVNLLENNQELDEAFEQPQVQVDATSDAIDFMLSNDVVQTDNEDGISPEDTDLLEKETR